MRPGTEKTKATSHGTARTKVSRKIKILPHSDKIGSHLLRVSFAMWNWIDSQIKDRTDNPDKVLRRNLGFAPKKTTKGAINGGHARQKLARRAS